MVNVAVSQANACTPALEYSLQAALLGRPSIRYFFFFLLHAKPIRDIERNLQSIGFRF